MRSASWTTCAPWPTPLPGARFDVIEACGHMATIEQLEAFNACWLDFCKTGGWGMSVGLVTGSAPFAGLPDNPASDLLDGSTGPRSAA
jgi:hypothetical protein